MAFPYTKFSSAGFKKLEFLELWRYKLTQFPLLPDTIQSINLSECSFPKDYTLDLSQYKNLISITLGGCLGIKNIIFPASIRKVIIEDCKDLRNSNEWRLPDEVQELKYVDMLREGEVFPRELTDLRLEDKKLTTIDDIITPVLKTLKILYLNCLQIDTIPDLSCTGIEKLSLDHCEKIRTFTVPFSLIELDCNNLYCLSLFPEIKHTKLKILKIDHCISLVELPVFPQDLTIIHLKDLDNISVIPDWKQTRLEKITIWILEKLHTIPDFPPTVKLIKIKLMTWIDKIPDFSPTQVEEISIEYMPRLKSLSTMPGSLKTLSLISKKGHRVRMRSLPKLDHTRLTTLKNFIGK